MNEESKQTIEFIWAVRRHGKTMDSLCIGSAVSLTQSLLDNLSWFTQHLSHIRTHVHAPKVALKVHLTSIPSSNSMSDQENSGSEKLDDECKPTVSTYEKETGVSFSIATPRPATLREDLEKDVIMSDSEQYTVPSIITDIPLVYGRPDTESLIREAVQSVAKDQRVLIAACGPTSLIEEVRDTAASCIQANGPAVELHCEQFGW